MKTTNTTLIFSDYFFCYPFLVIKVTVWIVIITRFIVAATTKLIGTMANIDIFFIIIYFFCINHECFCKIIINRFFLSEKKSNYYNLHFILKLTENILRIFRRKLNKYRKATLKSF